jgi:hypothetical protein
VNPAAEERIRLGALSQDIDGEPDHLQRAVDLGVILGLLWAVDGRPNRLLHRMLRCFSVEIFC